MKIFDNSQKIEVISWARQIEKNIRMTSPETADMISHEIEKMDEHKLTVAVVGLLKRGKSTFCNAFLGRNDDKLAPVGRFPTTGIITEFSSSDRDGAKVIFANQSSLDISYDEISSYVTEDGNPENKKNVFKVEVSGKFDLDKEIVLIDLPGDESIHAYHSEVVYNYLPNADIIIFLSDASDPISRSELSLLHKVKSSDMKKIFFVINKADKCDEEELSDAERHNRETLNNAGIAIENDIYTISAKQAMNNGTDNFDFQKLISDISEYLSNNRCNLISQSFYGRVMALAKPVIIDLQQQDNFSAMDDTQLEDKIRKLEEQKITMCSELKKGLEEFSDNWDDMLKEFENSLPEIRNNVEKAVIGEIEATSILTLGKKQTEKLPKKISETMEKEFSATCGILEKRAKESLEKLEKSCPSIASFLSDQNIDLAPQGKTSSTGGWIFTLVSGSTAYITGSVIGGAFTVVSWGGSGFLGTIAGMAGNVVNATVGGVATVIFGPLFLVAAVSTTIGFTAMTVSFIRKKKLQKENLIHDLKLEIRRAFDSVKLERIPYLRDQKRTFIDELKKEFNKTLKNLEKNLQDARTRKVARLEDADIAANRQLLLAEYSSLERQVIEE